MAAVATPARPPLLIAPALPYPPPEVRAAPRDGAGVVLRAVLRGGPLARTALARATGLSPAAVSRHTAELIGLGLLRELPPVAGPPRAGRPQMPVEVDPAHHAACGVHIAVDMMTFTLVDLRGAVLAEERIRHRRSAGDVLGRIRSYLPGFLARRSRHRSVLGLGVVTGGWVDSERGTVVEHSLLGWRNVPVRQVLSAATRLPVHVDGHARALARAELLFGAGSGSAELVQLFVGNVVDAAIATGGGVLRGRSSGAGDIAHLPLGVPGPPCACGRSGCLQATVSEHTLGRRAFAEGLIERPDFALLLERALDGHPAALRMFRERLRMVGRAAALLLDVLNPELLVVAEAAVVHLPDLMADLHEEVAAHSHLCADPEHVVVPTSFGEQVLAVSAGAVVLDAVHRRPMELRTAGSA
ncbi:ROK family protein [Streptomyces sp. NPDC017993]|uniref:ROK family transcriptional regulator n=1 Tax=Streptomyces sp. NPDC017993 TaxID=3365027 RepID=UPI0037A2DF2D